jgi:hypothetical protein
MISSFDSGGIRWRIRNLDDDICYNLTGSFPGRSASQSVIVPISLFEPNAALPVYPEYDFRATAGA